ncbi:hypothetical protein [Nocardia sp. X0981]
MSGPASSKHKVGNGVQRGIRAGTRVTVTAEGGYRPPDREDRRALDALVTRFRALASGS